MAGAPPVLVITGPTASGKTEVAVALADCAAVSLISMDSAMVYRGMDVGTAKPSAALRARYPHSLVDIRDPAQSYSAADFVTDADRAVRDALDGGRLPLLVGGTMLYLQAFRDGLAELPGADPGVRAGIREEAGRRGWPALYEALREVDPEAAAGIHPHNHVRVERALEVFRVTGVPLSRWWREHGGTPVEARLGVRLVEVAVMTDARADLAARIEARFRAMLSGGLIEEVAALRARGDLSPALPSMRAVGYRQVWAYLDGEGSHEALVEKGCAATRQLARRQLTWLRRWPQVTSFTPAPGAAAADLAGRIARHARLELS